MSALMHIFHELDGLEGLRQRGVILAFFQSFTKMKVSEIKGLIRVNKAI